MSITVEYQHWTRSLCSRNEEPFFPTIYRMAFAVPMRKMARFYSEQTDSAKAEQCMHQQIAQPSGGIQFVATHVIS